MASSAAANGKSKPVNVSLRARYKGKQFIIKLKALKGAYGLVQSPLPLGTGESMVLQGTGQSGRMVGLQLFAKVHQPYNEPGSYALHWQRLVSPMGTSAVLQFLQETMDMCVATADGLAHSDAVVDSEMVFYDFSDGSLHLPTKEQVISREALLGVGVPAGGRPRNDVNNGGHAGKARVPAPDSPPDPVEQAEDGDYVEMFGVRVSKDNWEKLDNLSYTSTSPDGEVRRRRSVEPQQQKANGKSGPPTGPIAEHNGNGNGNGKVSSFLRKLAGKLADK